MCSQLALLVELVFDSLGCSGYMSPEYAIDGFYSIKSDVFSFGVLMLEIISGKRNRGFFHAGHNLNLLGHVSPNYCLVNTNLFFDSFCFFCFLVKR